SNHARAATKAAAEVLSADGIVDDYEAGRLLAAAEWLASLRGNPSKDPGMRNVIEPLLAGGRKPPAEKLVQSCLEALERIAVGSQTRLRWAEKGFDQNWVSAIADLRNRLNADPIALPRPKRIRPSIGDIFEIPLPENKAAFGRVYNRYGTVEVFDFI